MDPRRGAAQVALALATREAGVSKPPPTRLSLGARAYLCALRIRWFDRGRPCYEAQETWARRIEVDVRTIRRWERELAAARVLLVDDRGNGRVLAPPPKADNSV